MLYVLASLIMIFLDIATKRFAIADLKPIGSVPVIQKVFDLTYLENRGASMGILQGKTTFFIVIVSIVVFILLYLLLFGKSKGKFYRFSLAIVIAGGVGNLIDRIKFGYVVDFLDFSKIGFPWIFNMADIFVVVGVILLTVALLFGWEKGVKTKKGAVEDKHDEADR